MSEDKGFLTTEQEQFIKDKLDQAIKGNAITEPLSDLALNFVIPFIDDKFGEKLIEKWNISDALLDNVRAAIDAGIAGDYETVADITEEVLVELVDTPLGDMYERLIVSGVFSIVLGLINKK